MTRITRDLAARLSRDLGPSDTWHDARDALGLATGGALGPVQLDLLTVWAIEARAENLADARVEAGISGADIVERATPRTLWLGLRYRP